MQRRIVGGIIGAGYNYDTLKHSRRDFLSEGLVVSRCGSLFGAGLITVPVIKKLSSNVKILGCLE
jgi:hypothetical protein